MNERQPGEGPLLCPSASPGLPGSRVFGVIGGTVEEPRVEYLPEPLPVTGHVLELAHPLAPAEVFRFTAPCAEAACRHFDGEACQLARRAATHLPQVVHLLPRCPIRRQCRWWAQEGIVACRRCPQVVSEIAEPTELQRMVATPP
jgi:hypothetical protein